MPRDMRRRSAPLRRAKPTFLIYCGAVRTEPDYFEGLKSALAGGSITVMVRAAGTDPGRLIRAAAAFRDRSSRQFDEVWCVFDVDQFDVASAAATAKKFGVNVAVSNPCFELWLLLHHDDCGEAFARCGVVGDRLRRYVQNYDKTRLRFADFADGISKAIERAKKRDPSGADHFVNPSSGVWVLVEKLMERMK